MSKPANMKIIMLGDKYKNEVRVDVSELELEEIEMLAANIVKSMLREAGDMPESDSE